jgi:hypothetical protein
MKEHIDGAFGRILPVEILAFFAPMVFFFGLAIHYISPALAALLSIIWACAFIGGYFWLIQKANSMNESEDSSDVKWITMPSPWTVHIIQRGGKVVRFVMPTNDGAHLNDPNQPYYDASYRNWDVIRRKPNGTWDAGTTGTMPAEPTLKDSKPRDWNQVGCESFWEKRFGGYFFLYPIESLYKSKQSFTELITAGRDGENAEHPTEDRLYRIETRNEPNGWNYPVGPRVFATAVNFRFGNLADMRAIITVTAECVNPMVAYTSRTDTVIDFIETIGQSFRDKAVEMLSTGVAANQSQPAPTTATQRAGVIHTHANEIKLSCSTVAKQLLELNKRIEHLSTSGNEVGFESYFGLRLKNVTIQAVFPTDEKTRQAFELILQQELAAEQRVIEATGKSKAMVIEADGVKAMGKVLADNAKLMSEAYASSPNAAIVKAFEHLNGVSTLVLGESAANILLGQLGEQKKKATP